MYAPRTASVKARVAAFIGAVLTSTVVLGSTVAGMQPRDEAGGQPLIALQPVTISSPAAN
jgi:hypothetical protein